MLDVTTGPRRSFFGPLLKWLCAVAVLVPLCISARFIYDYGCNSLYSDDFEILSALRELSQGELPLQKLLVPHDAHRFFFGRIVMLALGFLSDFNSIYQLYLNWFFIAGVLAIVALMTAEFVGFGKRLMALCLLDSMLLFSLRNYETHLQGCLVANSMAIFFFVAAIYALGRGVRAVGARSSAWAFVALVCAVVSTFSGTMATLAVWPLALLILSYALISSTSPALRKVLLFQLIIWAVVSAAAFIAYFHQYPAKMLHTISLDVRRVWFFARCAATLTGGIVFSGFLLTRVAGTLLLCATLCALSAVLIRGVKRRLDLRVLPPLCLLLFGLGSGLMIIFGRGESLGVSAMLAPRYAQFGAIGLCGVLALLSAPLGPAKVRHALTAGIAAIVVAGYVQTWTESASLGRTYLDERKKIAYWLRTNRMQTDECLMYVGGFAFVVREFAAFLESKRYNVFSEEQVSIAGLPRASASGLYHFDSLTETPMTVERVKERMRGRVASGPGFYRMSDELVDFNFSIRQLIQSAMAKQVPGSRFSFDRNAPTESTIEVSGWAADPERDCSGSAVYLKVGDSPEIPACYGIARRDVASGLGKESLKDSGFYASVSSRLLPPGKHKVSLLVVSADRSKIFETQTEHTLTIASSKRP